MKTARTGRVDSLFLIGIEPTELPLDASALATFRLASASVVLASRFVGQSVVVVIALFLKPLAFTGAMTIGTHGFALLDFSEDSLPRDSIGEHS